MLKRHNDQKCYVLRFIHETEIRNQSQLEATKQYFKISLFQFELVETESCG